MNIYLAIITTILVLTQVIRVTQNAIQLNRIGEAHKYNDELMRIWRKVEKFIDERMEDVG
jgi:hypothetical protein